MNAGTITAGTTNLVSQGHEFFHGDHAAAEGSCVSSDYGRIVRKRGAANRASYQVHRGEHDGLMMGAITM